MKQIELVLQNDGVKRNVIFPCTEAEYQAVCKELALNKRRRFLRRFGHGRNTWRGSLCGYKDGRGSSGHKQNDCGGTKKSVSSAFARRTGTYNGNLYSKPYGTRIRKAKRRLSQRRA